MSETSKKFFLTTPIYYVNARPHIGHAYSTIAADVIARRHRLLGDDTFFLTGTDEHGQKVQRSAEKAGVPPQQFTDEVSDSFSSLWKRMGITNDDFIRTTDKRHKDGVQKLWKLLEERGAIYLSSYTGQYCVSEEMFVEGPPGTIGPDGKPTETVTEENYFFRLSDYQLPLLNMIESGKLHVQPETTKNEVLSFLRGNVSSATPQTSGAQSMTESHPGMGGSAQPTLAHTAAGTPYVPGALKDLSISRTSFTWGIPVPGNEKHVVYVWLDALVNYMTAVGYGSDDPAEQAKFEKYWPADLHLVGKEITRFHCLYWPAFLLAANLPLPKAVVANGWLLFEESKMSKSRGNVVRTETILDAFGTLCPPPPPSQPATPPTPSEVVILSEAQNLGRLPDPLQSPTKAQQDLFASDVLRYFLLREIPFGQDGTFSFDALITRYNADLANGYGNLVSRTLTMIERYCQSRIPNSPSRRAEMWPYFQLVLPLTQGQMVEKQFETATANALNLTAFTESVVSLIAGTDQEISLASPWKLAKIDDAHGVEKLNSILYGAAEAIRIITALLYPVMPYATASVWRQLGLGDIEEAARNGKLKDLKWGGLKPGTKLGERQTLFPSIKKEDIPRFIQLMIEMESPAVAASEAATTSTQASTESATDKSVPSVSSALSLPPDEPTKPEATPTITIDDFAKVDLRVAQILVAERIPKADKLLRLEVDLGYEKRQILAGIAVFYEPEALIGRKVVIVANLAPRKMRGLISQGMVVAASLEDHGRPALASFIEEIELGARLR